MSDRNIVVDVDASVDANSNANASESATSKKRTRKAIETKLEIWNHFKKIKKFEEGGDTNIVEDGEGQSFDMCTCVYCSKEYKCNTSINETSALWKHFKICKRKPPQSFGSQTELCFECIKDGEGDSSLNSWKFSQNTARRKLALLIMEGELPFKFVEHPRFRSFCRSLQPKFQPISRSRSRRDVFGVYEDRKVDLQGFFKKTNQGICLTIDTWTSLRGMTYMAITAHFIDDGWTLRKILLNFCPIISHKEEAMGRVIEKCLKEWGINKIITCTVDNASANDNLVKYLKAKFSSPLDGEYMHMRCVTHIINLIVCDGLKDFNISIARVREAVKYISASFNRTQKFKKCAEAEGIQSKSLLCLDVCTRWNSTYLMLKTAMKFETAFERFEEMEPQYVTELEANGGVGTPTHNDWVIIRRLVAFLYQFYELTTKVFSISYVTSSNFFHEFIVLYGVLLYWKLGDDLEISAMAEKMLSKCDKYWGGAPTKMNMLLFVNVVLDPRYKLKYVDLVINEICLGVVVGEGVAEKVKAMIYKMFDEYKTNSSPTNQSVGQSSREVPTTNMEALSTIDRIHAKFKMWRYQVGGGSNISELDKYLSEGIEESGENFDILNWWSIHRSRFPILSMMARDLLAIPVSTVASEFAFCTGGRILNAFQSSLTPKIAEAFICGTDWIKPLLETTIGIIENMEEDLEEQESFENEIVNKRKSSSSN